MLVVITVSVFLHLSNRFQRATEQPPAPLPSSSPTPAPTTEQGMWTMNSIGRLGNQMGEYALAKMNGHQVYIQREMYQQLAPLFCITLPIVSSDVVQRIPWRNYGLHDWMSEEYRYIKGKYIRLMGYPCSWTFDHHIRQEILQEFSFHDHIKEEAKQYLAKLHGQRQKVTYVGVHVRRGDYVQVMPQTWKGVVADKAYLEKAMRYFRAKYQVFLVTSNGMEWCRENINASRGGCVFLGRWERVVARQRFCSLGPLQPHRHDHRDLWHLGSYLAEGETVYLANYTLPDSRLLQLFKPEAAFLPEWIGIDANLSPLLTGMSG
uniref:L-Fucosyltransferase n=1 Tax=Pelusios castaneus TaxID=367368 RepID=A0A8C8RD64_9SAUR